MKLSKFQTDTEKKEKGVWVEYAEGLHLLIARAGNTKCKEMTNRLMKPIRKKVEKGIASEEEISAITKRVVARHVLLDWKGLEDDDGDEIKYSEEKCLEIISDKEFEDFYNAVLESAADEANFRKEGMEDELGNSPAA